MDRERFEQLLEGELDGVLTEAERRELEAACEADPKWAGLRRQDRRLAAMLGSLGEERAPEGFAAAVMERIAAGETGETAAALPEEPDAPESEEEREPWWMRLFAAPALRWGMAAAVVLVLAAQAAVLMQRDKAGPAGGRDIARGPDAPSAVSPEAQPGDDESIDEPVLEDEPLRAPPPVETPPERTFADVAEEAAPEPAPEATPGGLPERELVRATPPEPVKDFIPEPEDAAPAAAPTPTPEREIAAAPRIGEDLIRSLRQEASGEPAPRETPKTRAEAAVPAGEIESADETPLPAYSPPAPPEPTPRLLEIPAAMEIRLARAETVSRAPEVDRSALSEEETARGFAGTGGALGRNNGLSRRDIEIAVARSGGLILAGRPGAEDDGTYRLICRFTKDQFEKFLEFLEEMGVERTERPLAEPEAAEEPEASHAYRFKAGWLKPDPSRPLSAQTFDVIVTLTGGENSR